MDIVWTIVQWIVYLFESFGFVIIALTVITMVINPGYIKWVDSIRDYIFMLDREDYYD